MDNIIDKTKALINAFEDSDLIKKLEHYKLLVLKNDKLLELIDKYNASDDDYEKIMAEFPADYKQRIERLSEYMASSGKSYKNHLATIRSWARKEKPAVKSGYSHDIYRYEEGESL